MLKKGKFYYIQIMPQLTLRKMEIKSKKMAKRGGQQDDSWMQGMNLTGLGEMRKMGILGTADKLEYGLYIR